VTRGKYAARAALRREDTEVRSEIGTYQHHVKRLTAENKELTALLASERSARKEEVRRLKAQLDEGLTPEILALRSELERHRKRADEAATSAMQKMEMYARLLKFTAKLLHNITGCTGLEATEQIIGAIRGSVITVADPTTGATINSHAPGAVDAEALQRVRGWRSSSKVVSHLEAVVAAAKGAAEK
jgi:predicted RNase H-like nuclease (RuvC/YqgF family)